MDKKQFLRTYTFVHTYEKLRMGTRWVLMSLMEYQNIFGLEDTFTVYPATLKQIFDIDQEKFENIADYLKNYNWITFVNNENNYTISINYDRIDERRNNIISYRSKKKITKNVA